MSYLRILSLLCLIFLMKDVQAQISVTLDSKKDVACNGDTDGFINISVNASSSNCTSPVLLINEFMVKPDSADGQSYPNGAIPYTGEYIELIGPAGLDISCYVLTDGDWTITFPQGTILPADGLFSVGNNNSPQATFYGNTYDLDVATCNCFVEDANTRDVMVLTNGGEYLSLHDNLGNNIDALIYGNPSANNTPPSGLLAAGGGVVSTVGGTCQSSVTIPAASAFTQIPTSLTNNNNDSYARIPDGSSNWVKQVGGSVNLCNGSVSAPGFTYLWSNGDTTEDISGLTAGTYFLTVTDTVSGLTVFDTFTITQPTAMGVGTTPTDVSCFQGNNGAIDMTIIQGTSPYSVVWSTGETTEDISGLTAGTYSATITDDSGCVRTITVPIDEPTALNVTPTVTAVTCADPASGTAAVTVTGGTAGYTYAWSNSGTNDTIANLTAGTYTVTITDSQLCTITASATVAGATALQLSVSNGQTDCAGNAIASLTATATGGTNITYLWEDGSTIATVANVAAGTYTVTATNDDGCTAVDSGLVSLPFQPQVDAYFGTNTAQNTLTTYVGETEAVGIANNQSVLGVNYEWQLVTDLDYANEQAASTTVTAQAAGEYTLVVTATAGSGCVDTDTLTMTVFNTFEGMPNAFKPEDAVNVENQKFYPVTLTAEEVLDFKVFNRFGQLVYNGDDLTNGGWDGTLNGNMQPADVYIYVLTYQQHDQNAKRTVRGQVTLIR